MGVDRKGNGTGKLRVGIFGAGAVGGYVGGCLAAADADVRFVGRADKEKAWKEGGLRLTDIDGRDETVPPQAIRFSTDIASLRHCDLVVLSVKSAQTEEAARSLQPVLSPQVTILSLQNGVRNGGILKAVLPEARILRGMVPFNIVWRGSNHLHRATEGLLAVEDDPGLDIAARSFLDAGLPLDRRTNIEAVQWAKLLLNLNCQ